MDLRSPDWLNDHIPHVDGYVSDSEIVAILMSNPEILKTFISTVGCSLSNRQIKETSDIAARWVDELIYCEHTEGLTDEMIYWLDGYKAILAWLNNNRTARMLGAKNGKKFRRQ
jgi:hypothetical protein